MNYQDHATNITRRLIDMIQTGSHGQWAMPWHTHDLGDLLNARNATTDSRYQGANVITLAIEALDRGYPTGEWATYKQWTDHGAQVRKGERSAQVIKWVTRKTQGDDQPVADGESREVRQLLPRVYAVFNAHQVDGYDAHPLTVADTPADEWFAAIGADVHYGSDRAYYDPRTDRIYVPAIEQFDDPAAFAATNLHEHIHWTGHGSRLDRLHVGKAMDSPEYAAEELVAELGAAIGCARLGISPTPRPDHAAYLAHWLTALDADPKQLFRSAAAAQRAVDHLDQLANPSSDEAAA
jgi:antirestriction protein ArdC